MQKLALSLLSLCLLAGCATQVMNVTYRVPQEKPLAANPVYLKIEDVRQDRGIISEAVKEKKIFSGGSIGLLNLGITTPQGKTIDIRDAHVRQAFQEAFRVRLESRGIGLLPEPSPDKTTVTIQLERIWLDLVDSTFKAEVSYLAKFSRGGKQFHEERISGRAEKYKILARNTAEESLSEAFAMSVNSLDLSRLEK